MDVGLCACSGARKVRMSVDGGNPFQGTRRPGRPGGRLPSRQGSAQEQGHRRLGDKQQAVETGKAWPEAQRVCRGEQLGSSGFQRRCT